VFHATGTPLRVGGCDGCGITLFVGAPVTSKLLQTAPLPAVQYTEALAIVSVSGGFASALASWPVYFPRRRV